LFDRRIPTLVTAAYVMAGFRWAASEFMVVAENPGPAGSASIARKGGRAADPIWLPAAALTIFRSRRAA
jgi:hypothetical protein